MQVMDSVADALQQELKAQTGPSLPYRTIRLELKRIRYLRKIEEQRKLEEIDCSCCVPMMFWHRRTSARVVPMSTTPRVPSSPSVALKRRPSVQPNSLSDAGV